MESALSNIRHYQSLGLKNTGASLEEVKRAYKKLSLRYHPDRNSDPSATAKFQEISTAYNVLSTPRKRQVYDAYGEQGLKMYEQYVHMADTDDGGSKIPLQPVTMLLLLCVALSLVILLAAAFGVLLLLYLDGALSSPLAVVLTPLWLIWACGLCCAYALLVSGRANRVYVARLALLLLCLTAFAVLLCVRADAGARLSYALVFLPLYLLEAADVANLRARCSKIIEGADAKPYNKDWMNKWEGQARIVAQPATTEEVSAVLNYCNERRLAVTTQGGKTGLVGGSVPVHDEVILSTTRLNTIEGLDEDTGVVTCGAGVVLETLDAYLREYGFVAPLDLGAAGTCTIGGNLATNAGGVRFVRYGSLRGACVGSEFVKADGTVVDCART